MLENSKYFTKTQSKLYICNMIYPTNATTTLLSDELFYFSTHTYHSKLDIVRYNYFVF